MARLQDEDLSLNFAQLTDPQDRVVVIATEPLTLDEPWVPFQPGELRAFVGGEPVVTASASRNPN